MQTEKELLTLREAASLVFKTDLTIRRLVKSGKLPASKENWIYLVKRVDLLDLYGKETDYTTQDTSKKDDQALPNLFKQAQEMAQHMGNMASFYKNEYENTQRMLTESRESTERRKEEIDRKIAKKDLIIKCLITALIILLVLFIGGYMVLSGKIILRF
jgi:ABC-type multidrug transport system fused ATPase/permease subunit